MKYSVPPGGTNATVIGAWNLLPNKKLLAICIQKERAEKQIGC